MQSRLQLYPVLLAGEATGTVFVGDDQYRGVVPTP